MKKESENTTQTKENLTQAFWSLYQLKKIEHITVKEITDKAGYHRSTFYEYFVDIYDVLNQLEDVLLEYIKMNVIKYVEAEQWDDFTQKIANIYEVKGNYLSVLLGENGDPQFAKKMKTIMRPVLSNVFGLSENDCHTAYIFEFGMSAIIGTLTYWYNNKKELPSKELAQLIRFMLETGIAPEIQKYSTRSISKLG